MSRLAHIVLIASIGTAAACSSVSKPNVAAVAEHAAKPEAATCRIPGPRAAITVAVTAGTEAFDVTVRGASVVVVPGDRGAGSVEVQGALVFAGRTEGLAFFPSAPVLVAGGVVQLGPMSLLREASPRGAELVAKNVEIGAEFTLNEVKVRCSDLTFEGSGDSSESAHGGSPASGLRSQACPEPCTYATTTETIDFYESPGNGERVRLTGATVVAELERRGGWTRVSTQDYVHLDGAQLTGWVEQGHLTRVDGGVGFTGGRSRASLGRGGQGGRVGVSGPGIYHGVGRIDVGTPVFAVPVGGEGWAVIRDGSAEFEVVIREGRERAEVWRGPFLPRLINAWVARGAVHAVGGKLGL